MLYISRTLPDRNYGVIDTDDGTETIVSYDELKNISTNLGVVVEGVELDMSRAGEVFVLGVSVYNGRVNNAKAAKRALLDGVSINVLNDEIVAIRLAEKVDESAFPIEVRVSDYARKLSGCVELKCWYLNDSPSLRLVIDKDVELTHGVINISHPGVQYDISGLASESYFVNTLYYTLLETDYWNCWSWTSRIKDKERRFQLWMIAGMMCCYSLDYNDFYNQYHFDAQTTEWFGVKLNRIFTRLFREFSESGVDVWLHSNAERISQNAHMRMNKRVLNDIIHSKRGIHGPFWELFLCIQRACEVDIHMDRNNMLCAMWHLNNYFGISAQNARFVSLTFKKIAASLLRYSWSD